ncbi:MAG: SIMPL domain-containing protein, partial [Xenococcaceae cyanobacterium]
SNNERKFIGYVATNIISFRIQTDKIGNLLDEAVKAGATRIDNLSFTAAEEAIASAQKQALSKATLNAQQQAEAVLKTLNLTAKETVSVKINEANLPQPLLMRAAQGNAGNIKIADTTPVIGGEQTVQATVTLQIKY